MFIVGLRRDRFAFDVFHDEVRTPRFVGPGVKDFGDVGMIHHGQGLSLGREPRDDLLGVHAKLDQLHRDFTANRSSLLGAIDFAPPAGPEFF